MQIDYKHVIDWTKFKKLFIFDLIFNHTLSVVWAESATCH